ncbi:phosphoglucomutase [Rufibacter radiotolerans]|uniref:Phosphoglucomutase n=1 Tax=Rufibacter radiotolerans TaxID=1379910 RepID=A0A0H4VJ50_9BACT|nr:phospho-sugar mutase [Rufibacter radiotolerans]AKQ45845.1 phosphoglucomutase [Rufibacter radiotolerans]
MENNLTLDPAVQSKITAWLDGGYDAETKAELQNLVNSQDHDALTDSFYKDLEFGTGGLRGIMGVGSNRMNRYTVGMATQGLSNYLLKSFPGQPISVAVAHDSRNNSPFFANVVADVFSANGIKVYFFKELRPTPELSFAIRHLGCQSGVVLTASHNPKEYNGYKAYWNDGGQVTAPHDKNIIAEVNKIHSMDQVKFERNPANIEYILEEVDQAYLDKVATLSVDPEMIKRQQDLKIVYTPIHGTGITLVPRALERFGFKNVHVLEAQSTPDGNFPTVVYPNPEEKDAMNLAMEKAKELDAELVLATDPDADRVGIAVKDLKGQWVLLNGNQTAALLTYYILQAWKKAGKLTGKEYIVSTIVTTDLINRIAEGFGVDCYETLTGFKYIATIMREKEGQAQYICGGEESYGFLVGDFVRDKDAVSACAMIAEMTAAAKDQGKSLFELMLQMYQEFGFYKEDLISLTKKGHRGAQEIQEMMQELRENPPQIVAGSAVVELIDYKTGFRRNLQTGQESATGLESSNVLQFLTEDGTKISARPSGTEPKIKFYFSVREDLPSADQFDKVSKILDEKIQRIIADLKLK